MLLTDLLFTLLNFFLFIAVIVVIVRRYSSSIKQDITEEKKQHTELVAARGGLKKHLKEVEGQWIEQENLSKNLAKKVAIWHRQFDMHRAHYNELRAEQNKKLIKRYEQQAMLRAGQRTQARVMPHAIAQARLELYEFFREDEQRARDYINKSINDVAGA